MLRNETEASKLAPVPPSLHRFQRAQVHKPLLLLRLWYGAISNTLAVSSVNWKAASPFNVA